MKDKYFRMLKFLFPDYSDSHIWGLIKLYYDKNNLHGKECAGENGVSSVVIESVCNCKVKEPVTFTEHSKIIVKCINCGKYIANKL